MSHLELTLIGAMIGLTLSHLVMMRRYIQERSRLKREVIETTLKLYKAEREVIDTNYKLARVIKKLDGVKARNEREG